MKNVLLLDLDGVLITTPPWKSDEIHVDGYSDFNPSAVENLNILLNQVDFEIWLVSSRRSGKSIVDFNEIFKNRNIACEIKGFIPGGTNGGDRLVEINAFLNHEPIENFLILDDDNCLHGLSEERKKFWIQTLPLIGFNQVKLEEAMDKVKYW